MTVQLVDHHDYVVVVIMMVNEMKEVGKCNKCRIIRASIAKYASYITGRTTYNLTKGFLVCFRLVGIHLPS